MKKYIFSFAILIIMIISFAYAKDFTDVDRSFWAYAPINQMLEEKILSGYPDGTFKPNNAITRAEFAKIMVLALDLKEDESTKNIKFSDVDAEFWANDYIKIASKYLAGYEENGKKTYSPNQHAIRADVAVALVLATGLDNSNFKLSTLDSFKDKNSIPANYRKYIAIAVENNLMKGFDDGTFKPKASLTRAQVSQLIYNTKPFKKESEPKDDINIIVGEDGFLFNQQDLSLDLGENWEKYTIGLYRASQRHLIYSYGSVGYQKYQNEQPHKTGRDENNREYSQYIDISDYSYGSIPYYNSETKETKYMNIPIAFKDSVPLDRFANSTSQFSVSGGQIYKIDYSSLNKIAEATATFYYDNEGKDTIFKQYLNTNSMIVNPEFSKKDYMTLKIKLTDVYGNYYTNYYYLFNKDLLKYENKYYPVISNGIFEENGIKKITLGSTKASEIKTYNISKNCKIPEILLKGEMYINWKPIIVCTKINEKDEIVQLIVIDDEIIGTGRKGDTFYDGGAIYKVTAEATGNDFNNIVYALWDENHNNPINTASAERWTVRPTTNGSAAPSLPHDGFGVVGRTYSLSYDTVDAWVVMIKNSLTPKYFMIANYGKPVQESTISESVPQIVEAPINNDYYHSEELKFNTEDLTIDLGKDFENYEFKAYNNTYKPSQRVLVYNGYYENGKEIKCEKNSNLQMIYDGSRELLSFIGNESSKENKNVILNNLITHETTTVAIPNPFRITSKVKGQEIFSEFAKIYGDTEEKRNSVNLANEKDKISFEFDLLNGLKEATIKVRNEGIEEAVEYTTTKKSFSFKLPEFKNSDFININVKITDKKDNSEHINYRIINRKTYELTGDFYMISKYVISSNNTIELKKIDEQKYKNYKLASYLRIPDDLKKGKDGLPTICWIGLDKSNKVGVIIPIDKIKWKQSDFGAYYSGPSLTELGEIDVNKKLVYAAYDEEKEKPYELAKAYTSVIKFDFDENEINVDKALTEINDKLQETYYGYFIHDETRDLDMVLFIEYPYSK